MIVLAQVNALRAHRRFSLQTKSYADKVNKLSTILEIYETRLGGFKKMCK